MVSKKKLYKELEDFNQELDKYLPKLDLSFLENKDFRTNNNLDDELVSLLASNLVDLKTEIALMRKNLFEQTEGVLKSVMMKEQEEFLNQMNRVYSKLIIDLKENFNLISSDIREELVKIRTEFNNLRLQNEQFSKKLKELNLDLVEFRGLITNFSNKNQTQKLNQKIIDKLIEFEHRFSNLENNLNQISNNSEILKRIEKLDNEVLSVKKEVKDDMVNITKNLKNTLSNNEQIPNQIKNNISNLSKKIETEEKKTRTSFTKKSNSLKDEIVDLIEKIESEKENKQIEKKEKEILDKKERKENILKENLKKTNLNNLNLDVNSVNPRKQIHNIIDMHQVKDEINVIKDAQEKIEKMFSIDEKLKKLDSLRE